jgi:hypothetical protein
MARQPQRVLVALLSRERLMLWAKASETASDGRPFLARRLLEALGQVDAEAACFEVLRNCLPDHFYNLTATKKRQYFDGIAVTLCDNQADADALFAFLKEQNWTGRTKSP